MDQSLGASKKPITYQTNLLIGEHFYMPTMIGMVYVLKWDTPVLDENALLSITELGPAGETWSMSSLSYRDGRIYARTMKELICIGSADR